MRTRLHALTAALLAAAALSACSTAMFAGADAGRAITDDRRVVSAYVADEGIEIKSARDFEEAVPSGARVVYSSFNRRVLITGQVPDQATKDKAAEIARKQPDTREVVNELTIGETASIWRRTQDGYLTTKVKARLLDDDRVSAKHVKVVTESGAVYLMGLLKPAEGQAAAETSARTQGVAKVVKVFEYIE
jgi:osmotically-inducible protein OsmY